MPRGLTPSSVTDYIAKVADPEALGLGGEELPSLEQLFAAIAERWWREKGKWHLDRAGSAVASIQDWLQGLPSCLNNAFSGVDTEPLGAAWGKECRAWRRSPWGPSLDADGTYWRALACEVERMARKRIQQLIRGEQA